MGNFSKSPQAELAAALDRDYVRVRFQQGKPALDRELNLAADLAAPQRLASRYLGNGIPHLGTDFAITGLNVATNDFTITAGRALVNGHEILLRANTTYRTQPNRGNVAPLPAGTSNVYLRVFEREVTAQSDPALGNPDDVTFETAVRDKVEWEVIVSVPPINAFDHLFLAVITAAPPSISDRRRVSMSLAAIRDELAEARGSAADLGDRLDVAHAATGALLANSVGTAQIAAQAVTQDKVAANAIAVPQLKRAVRFNGAITIQPNAPHSVVAFNGNRHATLLASVTVTSGTGVVLWQEFVSQALVNNNPVMSRGIRFRSEGAVPMTVDVEVFELLAT